MTPEVLCGNRPVRTIAMHPGADIIYDAEGQACVLKMKNDRGSMEILVSPEKKENALPLLLGSEPVNVTGYFRRRSGRKPDGSRHFIWCLVLFTVEVTTERAPIAA